MAPSEFFVRLQHGMQLLVLTTLPKFTEHVVNIFPGITGGFAPPTPSAIHTLTRSSDDPSNIVIQSLALTPGTRNLAPGPSKEVNADSQSALVDELLGILKVWPRLLDWLGFF